jgi:spore germination cell wall hydrolase CwlJ-like protein
MEYASRILPSYYATMSSMSIFMERQTVRMYFFIFVVGYVFFVSFLNIAYADTKPVAVVNCEWEQQSEAMCLACNIYHESRGEPYLGKLAVALVTRNRVMSDFFPGSFCEVVWEKHIHYRTEKYIPQFSWTLDGKSDKVYNRESWASALKIAESIIAEKRYPDITAGATHYHADYVHPSWADQLYPTTKIGRHFFYAMDEKTAYDAMEALASD